MFPYLVYVYPFAILYLFFLSYINIPKTKEELQKYTVFSYFGNISLKFEKEAKFAIKNATELL